MKIVLYSSKNSNYFMKAPTVGALVEKEERGCMDNTTLPVCIAKITRLLITPSDFKRRKIERPPSLVKITLPLLPLTSH